MIKKMLSALLCGAMLFTVVGCTSKTETPDNNNGAVVEDSNDSKDANTSTKSVKELVSKVVAEGYIPMAREASDEEAVDLYDLDITKVEEYAIAEVGRSPGVGFIAAVKAKDGKMDEAKAAFQKVFDKVVGKAFYYDEVEAAKIAKIEEAGDILYMTIFYEDNREAANKFIKDYLK